LEGTEGPQSFSGFLFRERFLPFIVTPAIAIHHEVLKLQWGMLGSTLWCLDC
jgi:hypothetical protein